MKFRIKPYDNANNSLSLSNVQITITLDNSTVYTGLLSGITTTISGSVAQKNYTVSIETGDVLLIEWATPLNETHYIGITAYWTNGVQTGLTFSQEFETYGYDIGINATTGKNSGYNANIILYPSTQHGDDWYFDIAAGLTTKVLSYRKPFTDKVVFYSMVSHYAYYMYTATTQLNTGSTNNWTVPDNAVINVETTAGYYTKNTGNDVIQYSITVLDLAGTLPDRPGTLINPRTQVPAKWLPVFSAVETVNPTTNLLTITPNIDFAGVTSVKVNDISRYVFLNLQLRYLVTDENHETVDLTALNVPIADSLAFSWVATPYIYTRVLALYSSFAAEAKLISFDYPLIEIGKLSYEIIPSNFQYVTKIGANKYRIYNPYVNSTLNYQLQTYTENGMFTNTGLAVQLVGLATTEIILEDGLYNIVIDGANGVLLVDNTIKNAILELITKELTNCGCSGSDSNTCGQSDLLAAITLTYFTYLNFVNELIGTTFLLQQLTTTQLTKIHTIDTLMRRLTKFISRIR